MLLSPPLDGYPVPHPPRCEMGDGFGEVVVLAGNLIGTLGSDPKHLGDLRKPNHGLVHEKRLTNYSCESQGF